MISRWINRLLARMAHLRFLGAPLLRLVTYPRRSHFPGSSLYWDLRYSRGGTSGAGSFGDYAVFKADVVNRFVTEHQISSVTEFGCGDGNQLSLMKYPSYLGLDISPTAINLCRQRFANDPTKRFMLYEPMKTSPSTLLADATASLDVIYHLVEDVVFEKYLSDLFAAAGRYVIIFSSNTDFNPPYTGPHVKHRRFSDYIDRCLPEWRLFETVPNPIANDEKSDSIATAATFHIYKKGHD